jgi:hypothetical protein
MIDAGWDRAVELSVSHARYRRPDQKACAHWRAARKLQPACIIARCTAAAAAGVPSIDHRPRRSTSKHSRLSPRVVTSALDAGTCGPVCPHCSLTAYMHPPHQEGQCNIVPLASTQDGHLASRGRQRCCHPNLLHNNSWLIQAQMLACFHQSNKILLFFAAGLLPLRSCLSGSAWLCSTSRRATSPSCLRLTTRLSSGMLLQSLHRVGTRQLGSAPSSGMRRVRYLLHQSKVMVNPRDGVIGAYGPSI